MDVRRFLIDLGLDIEGITSSGQDAGYDVIARLVTTRLTTLGWQPDNYRL